MSGPGEVLEELLAARLEALATDQKPLHSMSIHRALSPILSRDTALAFEGRDFGFYGAAYHLIDECWLQQMNLKQVIDRFPSKDHRRIDVMIGEKTFWNRGLGTEAIGLLVDFGFATEEADAIFGVVAQDNPRSRRAFEKNEFSLHDTVKDERDVTYDLLIRRGDDLPSGT